MLLFVCHDRVNTYGAPYLHNSFEQVFLHWRSRPSSLVPCCLLIKRSSLTFTNSDTRNKNYISALNLNLQTQESNFQIRWSGNYNFFISDTTDLAVNKAVYLMVYDENIWKLTPSSTPQDIWWFSLSAKTSSGHTIGKFFKVWVTEVHIKNPAK
jgi:hypothetical protein